MSKTAAAGLLFGLAGFLLGGAAYYEHFKLVKRMDDAADVSAHDEEMQGQFASRITALEQRAGGEGAQADVTEANKRISSLRKELTDAVDDVATLKSQIAGLALRIQALEKPR